MKAYRVLAQMTYQAYERGDDPIATLFARIPQRLGDDGLSELRATSSQWEQINFTVDRFTKPILQYARGRARRPNPTEEVAAYKACQNALTHI